MIHFLKKKIIRPTTIHYSLVKNMGLLILLIYAAMMTMSYISSSRSVKNMSRLLIHVTNQRIEISLNCLFEPVKHNLFMAQKWLRNGVLTTDDPQSFNEIFMPMLKQFDKVSAVMIADLEGNECFLIRESDRWLNRITKKQTWDKRTHWYEWKDINTFVTEYWKDLDYDPRKRPWFKGALETNDENSVYWTKPYIFYTSKNPGITASITVKTENEKVYIIGFDVHLKDISDFTTSINVSSNGRAVVMSDDDEMIGLPQDKRFLNNSAFKKSVLKPVEDLGIPGLSDALRTWKSSGHKKDEPFRYKSSNKKWWAGFQLFHLDNQTFWTGVIVPEKDFLADYKKRRLNFFFITLGAIVLAVLMARRLARAYSRPLELLARNSQRISNFNFNCPVPGKSRIAEVEQLALAQRQMLSALDSFSRYVPVEVVKELFRRGEVAQIGGRTEELTVLFTDIVGFTTISEHLTPEELTTHMADYFDKMLTALYADKATVDKFVGDAIVAFWGAPLYDEYHTPNAVRAIIRCQKHLELFNQRSREQGLPPLPTCFGLNRGTLVVGNVGSPSRLCYTVLGDTVNLSSRIEGLNRFYGTEVLAAESVINEAGNEFFWRCIDKVAVKGKKKAVCIYELVGYKIDIDDETKYFSQAYEQALTLYQSRLFPEALIILEELKTLRSEDRSVNRLIRRCQQFIETPPPEEWDGVAYFEVK